MFQRVLVSRNSIEKDHLEGAFNKIYSQSVPVVQKLKAVKGDVVSYGLEEISAMHVKLEEMSEKTYQVSDLHWHINFNKHDIKSLYDSSYKTYHKIRFWVIFMRSYLCHVLDK